ncbi:MAG: hypothetical protein ACRCZF_09100, partial [Gemmataceae bacterium]
MAMSVECPSCGVGLSLPENLAGKSIRCKSCGEVFTVPSAASVAKAKPTKAASRPVVDDDDDDDVDDNPRAKPAKGKPV